MLNFERLNNFYNSNRQTISAYGSPWPKFILLLISDAHREPIKQLILSHPDIKSIINRLNDPIFGINSLLHSPADYRLYGSFYWVLRFLADIGLTGEELGIGPLVTRLQLQQFEDGQFIVRYYRKKQRTISLVCMTAHLTYCLIGLGYKDSPTVNASLNFILTTQRKDGGWHCDRWKQLGEHEQFEPSCPAANIHVLRVLGQYGKKYVTLVEPAINQIFSAFKDVSSQPCIYECKQSLNLNKLRYPPHFTGLDILNVVHCLSFFPDFVNNVDFEAMVTTILDRWDGKHWLQSEKRIPDWSTFDFGKKSGSSEWISALFVQAMQRIYYKKLKVSNFS